MQKPSLKSLSWSSLVALALILSACKSRTPKSPIAFDKKVQNVRISSENGAGRGFNPCEPAIAISPQDPQKVVAGAVLDYVWYSEDGGRTWKEDRLKSSHGVYGDPVLMGDQEGNFYYLHLSNPPSDDKSRDNWLDRIVIQKSTDGGKSWDDGSYMGLRPPKDQDKHWIAIDPESQQLYVTWTEFDKYGSTDSTDQSRILFSTSTDGGKTWREAQAINQFDGDCIDGDDTPEGAVPAVGINGEVFVAWSYNEKIWFDRSTDGGKTWLEKDIVLGEQPGGWAFDIAGLDRCNGMPVTGVDRSQSSHRGTIYVNWCDQRNGEKDTDVFLAKSTDNGNTWSAPKRVNDDKAGKQQFLTWMAVDPATGYIYIVFYDRRDQDGVYTDVFLAYSTDGGETFTNQKISETAFKPTGMMFFGDYTNISAHNGVVRPIWARMDKGVTSVWTAILDVLPQQK